LLIKGNKKKSGANCLETWEPETPVTSSPVIGLPGIDLPYMISYINGLMSESYNKIPKIVVMKDLEEESVKKWQRKWTQTTKRRTTKEYFPEVAERLKMKLQLTQHFTAIVSGHGKTRDYLQRFKTIEEPTCPCGKGDQTADRTMYACERLTKETDRLKKTAI